MAGRVAYYGNIVKDGLILDLDAAKRDSYPGSGTTWSDISGFQNNGTLVNGPTFDSGNGGSVIFDGTDDYSNILNNSTLNSTSGTVNVWFYNTGTYLTSNLSTEIISKHDIASSLNGYGIYLYRSSGNIVCGTYIKDGSTNWFIDHSAISSSIWYCATMTYKSNDIISIYLNGISPVSRSISTISISSQPLRIGLSNDSYWSAFNGRVASTQIYNRALSAAEVTQNYNALKGRYGL